MAFQVSPGVNISEVDLTTVVPAVATTEGAIAGVFRWGPVNQRILIESEIELVDRYGKPDDSTFETFFTAASFLSYGNKLYVTRVADTALTFNAVANSSAVSSIASQFVTNRDVYDTKTFDANTVFVAKYPGTLGNSLKVSICTSANAFSQLVNAAAVGAGAVASAVNTSISVGSSQILLATANAGQATITAGVFTAGDILRLGNSSLGYQELRVVNTSISTANVTVNLSAPYTLAASVVNVAFSSSAFSLTRNWEYFKSVAKAPGTSPYALARGGLGDELHIVIADEDGTITNSPGTVLEVFEDVSRATDAVSETGASIFLRNVIAENSLYAWAANVATTGVASAIVPTGAARPTTLSFAGGALGETESTVSINTLATGYDLFKSAEDIDVSLILAGKARGGTANTQLANYIIDNICENRKDCVAFISPERGYVVTNSALADIQSNLVTFRNSLTNSSYAFLDSGYKYT